MGMARVLISSFGSYGDVHPALGLAVALRRRGHQPVMALPAFYRDDVEREGLELRPVRPDLDLDDGAAVARVMHPVTGARYLFRHVIAPAVRDSYHDLHAASADVDLIVAHPAAPAGPMVAHVRGLPWVSLVLAPVSFFSRHDPAVPPPPVPAWARGVTRRSTRAAGLVNAVADHVSRRWARPVMALRRELGLPGGNPWMEAQHSPWAVLALFSRLLAEPQPDWPRRVRVTGPVLFGGRAGAPAMTPDLERFLDDGDPPLVFTLGSSAVLAPGDFFREAARAAHRLGRRAVLLVGGEAGGVARDRDVIAVPWADHGALFPRASAIIHQAGAGTLHQALRAGRPQLAVPHGFDQPDNAHRAARLGVARVIAARRFRDRRVAAELARLLEDPAYQDRARDAAAVVASEPGAAAAVDAIEQVLAGPRAGDGGNSS
jgi:rhamnosyltransferase subunit B